MSWPKNHLPKYRKHRASGQAIVTLNGRDFYLGPHNSAASKQQYDRLISEWLTNRRQPLDLSEGEITLVELCADYLIYAREYYQKDGRCTGVVPGIKSALKYVHSRYGRDPAAQFGPLALEAIQHQMIKDGLSRGYINEQISRIRKMFKWGVSKQLIPVSTYEALRTVCSLRKGRSEARETVPVKPVDEAVVEAILKELPEVVADMVQVQLLAAMRPGEVRIMRPCDIDRSREVWKYTPQSHKTEHHGQIREIPIGPRAQSILLKYLARDAGMYCFRPIDSEQKRRAAAHAARITPESYGNTPGTNKKRKPRKTAGEYYTKDSYLRAIQRACDKAFPHPELGHKIKATHTEEQKQELREWQKKHRWFPNQLRHSAGTKISEEFGMIEAQKTLGHANLRTTEIYAEWNYAQAENVAKQIG